MLKVQNVIETRSSLSLSKYYSLQLVLTRVRRLLSIHVKTLGENACIGANSLKRQRATQEQLELSLLGMNKTGYLITKERKIRLVFSPT